jgi:DNA-binding NtrC family response regulator
MAALQAMLDRNPDLGVIVISGVSPDPALRELLTEWSAVFLPKPFAPEELVRAVDDAIEARLARRHTSLATSRGAGEE